MDEKGVVETRGLMVPLKGTPVETHEGLPSKGLFNVAELQSRLDRAEAEAESLRADAERYRAMRDDFPWSMFSDTEFTALTLHMPGVSLAAIGPNAEDFDAAIDAARKRAA